MVILELIKLARPPAAVIDCTPRLSVPLNRCHLVENTLPWAAIPSHCQQTRRQDISAFGQA